MPVIGTILVNILPMTTPSTWLGNNISTIV